VSIGAEAVILLGGNHAHRTDWFSLYPFPEVILDAYKGKGDTHIMDGAWIGMQAMIMPGVTIGEGAIVTKDVAPYTIVAGNPVVPVAGEITESLLALDVYNWPQAKFDALRPFLCASDMEALIKAAAEYEAN